MKAGIYYFSVSCFKRQSNTTPYDMTAVFRADPSCKCVVHHCIRTWLASTAAAFVPLSTSWGSLCFLTDAIWSAALTNICRRTLSTIRSSSDRCVAPFAHLPGHLSVGRPNAGQQTQAQNIATSDRLYSVLFATCSVLCDYIGFPNMIKKLQSPDKGVKDPLYLHRRY